MVKSLGANEKLGLTGRPGRPYGMLGTARLYRFASKMFAFYPAYLDVSDFYLSHDVSLLITMLRVNDTVCNHIYQFRSASVLFTVSTAFLEELVGVEGASNCDIATARRLVQVCLG